jgi:hypothetical protein
MTAMSRKFYQKLAAEFKARQPSEESPEAWVMWHRMVRSTTDVISEGNPSFDRARFLTASGMPDKSVSAYA